jgi:hypothetical protein
MRRWIQVAVHEAGWAEPTVRDHGGDRLASVGARWLTRLASVAHRHHRRVGPYSLLVVAVDFASACRVVVGYRRIGFRLARGRAACAGYNREERDSKWVYDCHVCLKRRVR